MGHDRKPVKMDQKCDVTFKTHLANIRDLFGTGIRLTVNPRDQWSVLLQQFPLDPSIHFLKSSDGKNSVSLHDLVEDYTRQFKSVRQHYIVYIHKMDKGRQQEYAQLNEMNRVKRNQRAVRTASPAKKQPPKKRSKKSVAQPNIYEEDGFVMPSGFAVDSAQFYNAGVAPPAVTARYAFVDDDVMSQDSQDSQDLGEDIKSHIVDRLVKRVSNGDMHRIRAELEKLKANQNYLKTSRRLPFTLNMLQNVFLE